METLIVMCIWSKLVLKKRAKRKERKRMRDREENRLLSGTALQALKSEEYTLKYDFILVRHPGSRGNLLN